MAEKNNNDEQIFNEDELQDIMNEFENLEREFHEGEPESEEVEASAEAPSEDVEEEGELHVSESEPDNVVQMAAKPKPAPAAAAPSHTVTNSNGVSMSLEFPIGEQVAQIGISPEYGFSFNMDGVEITIDAENGCIMTLPGGMTFNIPVSAPQKSKKSA